MAGAVLKRFLLRFHPPVRAPRRPRPPRPGAPHPFARPPARPPAARPSAAQGVVLDYQRLDGSRGTKVIDVLSLSPECVSLAPRPARSHAAAHPRAPAAHPERRRRRRAQDRPGRAVVKARV